MAWAHQAVFITGTVTSSTDQVVQKQYANEFYRHKFFYRANLDNDDGPWFIIILAVSTDNPCWLIVYISLPRKVWQTKDAWRFHIRLCPTGSPLWCPTGSAKLLSFSDIADGWRPSVATIMKHDQPSFFPTWSLVYPALAECPIVKSNHQCWLLAISNHCLSIQNYNHHWPSPSTTNMFLHHYPWL